MNLLNKLDSIEIDNTSRIDSKDLEFCNNEEKEYKKAMECIYKIFKLIKEELNMDFTSKRPYNEKSNNSYLNYYSFDKVDKLVNSKTEVFIDRVINYFAKKYKVALKKDLSAELFIKNQYDYNNIIDYIYEQLDGLDFTERAKQDVIQNTKKIYWYNEYRKTSNVILNKSKIVIDEYFAKKHWYHNYYVLCDNYFHIFKSLYLFDKGFIQKDVNELQLRYCGRDNEEREDAFDKYEVVTFDKLKSIKFFKNGKMELVFTNVQYAKEFAYEYLGYQDNEVKK